MDNVGVAGTTASYWASNIAATLFDQPFTHQVVLYNLGVNDFGTATQGQWIADVETVADAVHAKWPSALFYIMRPWKVSNDANAATYSGWIDTIVASRSSWVKYGPDEAVWLKGADNGATNTTDGIHYSVAGEAAAVTQWKTVLGY